MLVCVSVCMCVYVLPEFLRDISTDIRSKMCQLGKCQREQKDDKSLRVSFLRETLLISQSMKVNAVVI